MKAFIYHFAFEFRSNLRNPELLLLDYLFPLGFYVLMGAVMTQINPTFKDTMVPAMVIFAVMVSTVLGIPSPLVSAREAGVFRSYKINGVPSLSILVIPALSTIFHALITSLIICVTAVPLFKGLAPTNWGIFALLTLLIAFSYGSIAALIGVISTTSQSTVLWSQLIFLPSMILGGLMLPVSMLPRSIQPFTFLLPTTHALQAYIGLTYGQNTLIDPMIAVAVLLVSGLLAFGLSVYLFNWDSKNTSRRGHPLMALLALVPYIVSVFLV